MPKESNKYIPFVATAVACSAAAALSWKVLAKSSSKVGKSKTNGMEEVVIALLPVEHVQASGGAGENAMSSITWFDGDYRQVIQLLRNRSMEILKANRWLGGRILPRNGKPSLVYFEESTTTVSDQQLKQKEQEEIKKALERMLDEHFQALTDVDLVSRDVPLDKLGGKLSRLIVKNGPKEVLWKIRIIPCSKSPHEKFAIFCSMSHVVGDGATFFKIQNMLLAFDEPIESLICERINSTEDQQIEAMGGKEEYKILQSGGFIVNMVYGVVKSLVTKEKSTTQLYVVNEEGMKETKRLAVDDADGSVKFVSSNDVLCSWLFQKCNCVHGAMAFNFRGRLDKHTDMHAGNYENVIFYRKEDSATPALIRNSIQVDGVGGNGNIFQRRVTSNDPIPSFLTMASGSVAIATNWASFSRPSLVPGCTEEIQMPLYNAEMFCPSTLVVMIIFRAGRKGLGVLVFGPEERVSNLKQNVPFLDQDTVLI